MKNTSLIISIIFVFLVSCNNTGSENSSQHKNRSDSTSSSTPLFSLLKSSQTNVDFVNKLEESASSNIINYHYFYNGGGVAAGDLNNDGLMDLVFTSNQNKNRIYLNQGDMKFKDATELLGKQPTEKWSTGVSLVDINHDGWLDIYICQSGNLALDKRRNLLYINQEGKGFKEEAASYGLDDPAYSTQAAFFDYDKDGDLDLYLLNHEIHPISNYNKKIRNNTIDPYVGDKLFKNENGKFVNVSRDAGIHSSPYGFGLGIGIGDLNNDGWPDIYVTNDFTENDFLYFNNHDGTFTEDIHNATKHISNYGMGCDINDFNNDGKADIIVVDMVAKDNFRQKTNMSGMNPERFWQTIKFGFQYQYMYNTLQLNQGDEKFSEVGQLMGVSNSDWSWSPLFADLNGDGKKDILITNGLRKDVRNNDFVKKYILNAEDKPIYKGMTAEQIILDQLKHMPSKKIPNYVFQNQGDLAFNDKTVEWGLEKPSFSNGVAYVDLDNDGDLDLVMNNVGDEAFIYQNNKNKLFSRHFINIKLKGNEKNINGIGAKIEVKTKKQTQTQELYTSRGFQSSVPPISYFGLGKESAISMITVHWADGKESRLENPKVDQLLTIDYANAIPFKQHTEKESPLMADITKEHKINYLHYENPFDDYKLQELLPHKLSELGPALAVGDINGDGLEDFIIGGATSIPTVIYQQLPNGEFKRVPTGFPEEHRHFEDVDAVFFDADNDGDQDLYIASGSYEFNETLSNLYDRLYLNNGKGKFTFAPELMPDVKTNSGCVTAADYDRDGDIDLFVGGRVVSAKYPYAPKSFLLRNDGGKFSDQTANLIPEAQKVGMVTAVNWIDINNDKQLDLVLVGEWMPITVFKQTNGKFQKLSEEQLGLSKTSGWWFGLQPIDYDKDGDIDFVAGNLGLNFKYKASKEHPFKVFASDFDNNNTVDIVLSYAQNGDYYPVRGRSCSSQQMPYLKEKYPDYKSFASADVYDILGKDKIKNAIELEAYTFASTLFENNNGKFTPHPLARDLQISSISSMEATDVNQDGYPDVLLAGNLYGAEVETPRADASYGNLLLGNGTPKFTKIPTAKTSFFGEGDIRGIKSIRIGKGSNSFTAFLVARNNASLKLFRYLQKEELAQK